MNIHELETPSVVVDLKRLERNLAAIQKIADNNNIQLRPHIKTHKSIEIARRQIGYGACGLTVATVEEALVFMRPEFVSLTVSRPIVNEFKLGRLLLAAKDSGVGLSIVVDSSEGVTALIRQSQITRTAVNALIKIDVGLKRCGIKPEWEEAYELIGIMSSSKWVTFSGMLSHAGQAYAAHFRDDAAKIAEHERELMLGVKEGLLRNGIEVPVLSVGSTPTVLASDNFEGITEIRPGNYVFMDETPLRMGLIDESSIALSVLATIISKNSDFFIIDAGSKTLSSDKGGHGLSEVRTFGAVYPEDHFLNPEYKMPLAALSEEHGKVSRHSHDLKTGSRVRIVPNHSCPVINLARNIFVEDESEVLKWNVDAASCSR